MYYKILKEGTAVDTCSDPITYVKKGFKGIPVRSKKPDFFGVVGDSGKEIYALVETDGYELVTLEEVSESEYGNLKKMIAEDLPIEEPEPGTDEISVTRFLDFVMTGVWYD